MVTAAGVTWSFVAIARRAGIRVLTLTLCCTALLVAAADDYEGKTVGSIRFEPADQPLTYEQLTAMLAVEQGRPLRSGDVRDSIQRLYGSGEYADIAVDASLENGRVSLRFITKPAYFIGYISSDNVPEPPNHGQILTAAKLQLGSGFSPTDVQQAAESISELLKRNGFFKPMIAPQTFTREDVQQVNVHFQINSGRRARFGGLEITGKPERSASDILASTGWKGFHGWLVWRPVTYKRIQSGLHGVRSS